MSCKNCSFFDKDKELEVIPFASHKIVLQRKEREKNRLKVALVASWIVAAVIIVILR